MSQHLKLPLGWTCVIYTHAQYGKSVLANIDHFNITNRYNNYYLPANPRFQRHKRVFTNSVKCIDAMQQRQRFYTSMKLAYHVHVPWLVHLTFHFKFIFLRMVEKFIKEIRKCYLQILFKNNIWVLLLLHCTLLASKVSSNFVNTALTEDLHYSVSTYRLARIWFVITQKY